MPRRLTDRLVPVGEVLPGLKLPQVAPVERQPKHAPATQVFTVPAVSSSNGAKSNAKGSWT